MVLDHASRGYHPVIDSKVVMLMPGWYPCIPGWHCDGVIRADRQSQPDINTINDPVYHYIGNYATHIDLCPTEVVTSVLDIPVDEGRVWQSVDWFVSRKRSPNVKKVVSGEICKINRATVHRGTKAEMRGWRMFLRLSFYHMPVKNEIRKQVQVYPESIGGGW